MGRLLMIVLAMLAGGCGHTTDDWIRQLKDAEAVKRREAVRELASLTTDAARVIPALCEALNDENSYVRRDAAIGLGKFGPEARPAVPVLLIARKDKEPSVRKAADASLKQIDPSLVIGH
jgi:HEAT repeat protein